MLFICRNRIRLFVCLQMLCRPPDTWVACTVTVPGLPHAQHISMDLPHATEGPLQECRLFGVPALGWPWGCSQKGQFRKLTHLEAGKEQLWQQSELLLVLRVLRDIFKSGTKCYNNLCHAFTFIWMYISFGTCIFFLSKIFAEFISKRLFNKNLSFFFFFLSHCWIQKILAEFSEAGGKLPGKDACTLHMTWKVSPERGYSLDWVFVQWLHLNIQLLSWQILPWNELFCLASCCPVKLHFISLYRNYPKPCFCPWSMPQVGRQSLLISLRGKALLRKVKNLWRTVHFGKKKHFMPSRGILLSYRLSASS